MADITASSAFDNTQYSKGLQAALREAKSWRRNMERTLNFDPVVRLNNALKGLKGNIGQTRNLKITVNTKDATTNISKTAQAASKVKKELTDVQKAVLKYRNATLSLRNEIEAGVITQQEGIATAKRLRDESLKAAEGAERWSKGYRELLVASGRADRTLATLEGRVTKLGFSQNASIGITDAMNGSLTRLQQTQAANLATTRALGGAYRELAGAVTAVLATAGVVRYGRALVSFSKDAAVARNTLSLFYVELAKSGVPVEQGRAALKSLAAQFQTTEDAVGNGVTLLLRYGATLDEAVLIMQRAGASALAAGHTAAQGFNAASQAIIGEMSQALNRIGIAGNLSTAYIKEAKALGIATTELTNHQKILAVINNILPETESEYEALGTTLSGFVGAQNRASTALTNFRRAAGKGAETFLAPLFNAATRLLNVFNSMPPIIQTAITAFTLLVTSVAAVTVAYVTLRAALGRAQVMQKLVTALVEREAILRTRLGGLLLALAGRYKLLSAAQLEATAAARGATGAASLWTVALTAIRGALTAATTAVGRLTVASLRFALTPVGAALTAIAVAVALITTAVKRNQAVIEPAMRAIRGAFSNIHAVLQPTIDAFKELFAEGSALSRMWRGVLIRVAQLVARALVTVVETLDAVAQTFQFLTDLSERGPIVAFRNLAKASREAAAKHAALRREINSVTRAMLDGTVQAHAYAETTQEDAEAAEAAAAKLKELKEQAADTAATFNDAFKQRDLQLLPDGAEKDIQGVRLEFEKLRQEIIKAGDANEQFKPFVGQFLSRAYEQEQRTILQIQRRYEEERRKAAEDAAKDLADAIQDRERAIVDEQTRGQLNQAASLRLAYQRRIQDTERTYAELLARAKDHELDTTRLEQDRTDELLAIQQGYRRDVTQVYEGLYAALNDRQRQYLRQSAQDAGRDRDVLGLDYQQTLSDLSAFYERQRSEAAGNATLLASIDRQEADERRAVQAKYWSDILTLTKESGAELTKREADIERRRAEAGGDAAAAARIQAAQDLRDINAAYDKLEAAAAGNAEALARIANARNAEIQLANDKLQATLDSLADEAFTAAMQPAIDQLTAGLDTADKATLDSVRTQLESWKAAYGRNAGVASIIDKALDEVTQRYDQLEADAGKALQSLIDDARELAGSIASDDAKRDLSDLDQALADAAEKAARVREQQARIAEQLVTATGQQREQLIGATRDLDTALATVGRDVTRDAERITRDAVQTYLDGMKEARSDAAESAAQLLQADVTRVLQGITGMQQAALQEVRTNLMRQLASLTLAGFDTAALAPIRRQLTDIDALLAQHARLTADFAADQYDDLRKVAAATLDQTAAQRVSNETYVEVIRLRRAALTEAEEEAAGVDELATRTRDLTNAQLDYLASLQQQVTDLQALRGQYEGVFSGVADLAQLVDKPVPLNVIRSQRQLALAALDAVRAAQEAGQSFAQYGDDLSSATRGWQAFQSAATTAINASLRDVRRRFEDGLVSEIDLGQFRQLALRIVEAFGIGLDDAHRLINDFIAGTVTDPLATLEVKQPQVLSDIFRGLNEEAAQAPDTIQAIDDKISTLQTQVQALKTDIASAVNFGAAGEQLVSGYKAVIEQVEAVTGETFAGAATQAVQAFTDRFDEEAAKLQAELDDQLGDVAQAAGLTAGEGLMRAFAQGVTDNQGILLRAVQAAMAAVDEFLPHSDAKRGPLADLTNSGRMLLRTFAKGAMQERSRLGASMTRLLGVTMPTASLAGLSAANGALSRGPVNVNVDGRSTGAPGPLALDARRLVGQVERELTARGLKGRA